MVAALLALLVLAVAPDSRVPREQGESVHAILREESPDVFLAKATLRQYLERAARNDRDGVRRLTHPKALPSRGPARRRGGAPELARWQDDEPSRTFELRDARSAGPGAVLVEVAEDDEAATYVLFKSHGSWLVADKRPGIRLGDISDESIRAGYPGWVDHQALTQARRAERSARVNARSPAAPPRR
jgi:hypothetical protein